MGMYQPLDSEGKPLEDAKGNPQVFRLPDALPKEQEAVIIQQILNKGGVGKPSQEFIREREEVESSRIRMERQEIEKGLGAPLRTVPGTDRPMELDRPGLRFDVARSDLVDEKAAKLRAKLPEAEIKIVDIENDQVIGIRLPGETEFVLLDSGQLQTFSDVADVGGVLFNLETAGTILGAIATRGASLMGRAGGQAAGAAVGRALDIGIEMGRGFEQDPLKEIFVDITTSAGLAATGEALFALPRRGINRGVGASTMALTPQEQAAQRTAREAGTGGFTPGQLNPTLRAVENQSIATSKRAEQLRDDQLRAALEDLQRLRDEFGNLDGLTDDALDEIVRRSEADIFALVTAPVVSREQSGKAVKTGRKEFVRIWKQGLLKRRYDKANAAGSGAAYNLEEVQSLARETKRGPRGRGKPKDNEIIGPDGEPITDSLGIPESVTKASAVQLRAIQSQLSDVIDSILKLDPNVAAFEGNTAFEQLKALRTQLFDIKNATIQGTETIDNRLAGQMWDALKNLMENPVGGNDDFVRLLRSANAGNRTFERILEVADLKIIALNTQPGKLARMIAVPGNARTLRLLKRIIPEKDFKKFKDGFITDILSEPEKIGSRLDAFRSDKKALAILLDPSEEGALRLLGKQLEQFRANPIQQLLKRQTELARRPLELLRKSKSGELAVVINKGGGKNSPVGKNLRGGLIQSILDVSETTIRGRKILDADAALRVIERLDKNGVLETVLLPNEVKALRDRAFMLSFFKGASDTGASIQAAEASSSAMSVFGPGLALEPVKTFKKTRSGLSILGKNAVYARIFMSPRARNIFVGAGRKQLDLTTLRALSAITVEVLNDLQQDAEFKAAKKDKAAKKESK